MIVYTRNHQTKATDRNFKDWEITYSLQKGKYVCDWTRTWCELGFLDRRHYEARFNASDIDITTMTRMFDSGTSLDDYNFVAFMSYGEALQTYLFKELLDLMDFLKEYLPVIRNASELYYYEDSFNDLADLK